MYWCHKQGYEKQIIVVFKGQSNAKAKLMTVIFLKEKIRHSYNKEKLPRTNFMISSI